MHAHGQALRASRIADDQGNYLLVPMDHAVTVGPLRGLDDPVATTRVLVAGGASGVIVHKGLVRRVAPELYRSRTGLVVHVSASTNCGASGDEKVTVATVEEAIALGADALSVHVNLGAATEGRMLEDLGRLTENCHRFGLPLLAMVYRRGPRVQNPFDADGLAHAARVAEELGADLVKVNYAGSVSGFAKVVGAVAIPVLVAGGETMDSPEQFLTVVHEAREAGARGISVGRNIWQVNDPRKMMAAVAAVFSNGESVAAAARLL